MRFVAMTMSLGAVMVTASVKEQRAGLVSDQSQVWSGVISLIMTVMVAPMKSFKMRWVVTTRSSIVEIVGSLV
jgi:hypothetical protein